MPPITVPAEDPPGREFAMPITAVVEGTSVGQRNGS